MKKFISYVLVATMALAPSTSAVLYAQSAPDETSVVVNVDEQSVVETEQPNEEVDSQGNDNEQNVVGETTSDTSTEVENDVRESDVVLVEDDGESDEVEIDDVKSDKSEKEKVVAKSIENTVDAVDVPGVKVSVVRRSNGEQLYTNENLSTVVSNLGPGQYNLTIESVPKNYFIIQKLNEIEVFTQGSPDPFRIAIGTTEVNIKAVDKATGQAISGVKGTLINERGQEVYTNVSFPIHTDKNQPLAPGEYSIHLTSVPGGYVIPSDKVITVASELDPQTFSIEVGHTKVKIHAVNDATDRELTDVKIDLLKSNGTSVLSNIKLPFDVTTSDDAAYIAPGTYKIHVRSVPDGYVIPDDITINVKRQEKEQTFEVRLLKISITVKAQDVNTKQEVPNVAATIFNSEGEIIAKDVDLRYVGNYVAVGSYKLHVTHVPDGYALPKSDKVVQVRAISDKQTFTIDLDCIKGHVVAVDNKTGNAVTTARATFVNDNGHEVWSNQMLPKYFDYLVPGSYTIKMVSVPDGYLMPANKTVTLQSTSDKQTFKVALDFTKAVFGAKDATTGSALSGVKATIYDPSGRDIARNTVLPYRSTHLPVGKYKVRVSNIPAGYATSADATFDLKGVASEQSFNVGLKPIKTKVNYRDKATGKYIPQEISMHFENEKGRAVAIYTTSSGWKQIDKVLVGTYKAVFDKVPSYYKKPAESIVSVIDSEGLQEYTFNLEMNKQILLAVAKAGNKSITYTWNKIEGADGYDIYMSRCGKKMTKVATINGNSNFKFKREGLQNNKEYKAKVVAWEMVGGKKRTMYTSPDVHSIVKDVMGKYVNAKSVSIKSKTNLTLKKNKTSQIKATVTKMKKNKTLFYKNHTAKLRYYSSNSAVASVTKFGKVKGKSPGKCKIYVLATNGVKKAVNVTVK